MPWSNQFRKQANALREKISLAFISQYQHHASISIVYKNNGLIYIKPNKCEYRKESFIKAANKVFDAIVVLNFYHFKKEKILLTYFSSWT